MSIPLPVEVDGVPCWQRIGVRGDRSCPELLNVTHCHNCPVFSSAGRRFLNALSPPGYLDEWTARLATPEEDEVGEEFSALVFRLGTEWLALPIAVLIEITTPRTPHRIPHRAGLLAGLVNIRGELYLSVRLDLLLGVAISTEHTTEENPRLVVVRRESDAWVFPVAEVDQVHRFAVHNMMPTPPTLSRAVAKLSRGVLNIAGRSIGVLDDARVFQALRERTR